MRRCRPLLRRVSSYCSNLTHHSSYILAPYSLREHQGGSVSSWRTSIISSTLETTKQPQLRSRTLLVEMVLEPCTGVVPRLGWLGLGRLGTSTIPMGAVVRTTALFMPSS